MYSDENNSLFQDFSPKYLQGLSVLPTGKIQPKILRVCMIVHFVMQGYKSKQCPQLEKLHLVPFLSKRFFIFI